MRETRDRVRVLKMRTTPAVEGMVEGVEAEERGGGGGEG